MKIPSHNINVAHFLDTLLSIFETILRSLKQELMNETVSWASEGFLVFTYKNAKKIGSCAVAESHYPLQHAHKIRKGAAPQVFITFVF